MKAKFIQKMMAGALSIALVVAPSMSVLASTDPVTPCFCCSSSLI